MFINLVIISPFSLHDVSFKDNLILKTRTKTIIFIRNAEMVVKMITLIT
jgi:hypothetical protein